MKFDDLYESIMNEREDPGATSKDIWVSPRGWAAGKIRKGSPIDRILDAEGQPAIGTKPGKKPWKPMSRAAHMKKYGVANPKEWFKRDLEQQATKTGPWATTTKKRP